MATRDLLKPLSESASRYLKWTAEFTMSISKDSSRYRWIVLF